MQKARRRPPGLRPLVDERFQVLFHSPVRGASHLSLAVLVLYRSSGSIQPCGMVPAASDRIPRVPPYSGSPWASVSFPVRGSHPLRRAFPGASRSSTSALPGAPTTPAAPRRRRFRLRPFRSPLLGASMFLSPPAGTEMFQFPAFAPDLSGGRPSACRVAPFGHPRIITCLRFPTAFRSLPRPSSPPEA